jgi:hypothetical protein
MRQHDGGLSDFAFDPLLASLRDDPRFAALARRIGLPPTPIGQARSPR